MKICWDNIEDLFLRKDGRFQKRDTKKIYCELECKVCGEPFLGNKNAKYCSQKCMINDPDFRKKTGKFKNNLIIYDKILTTEQILELQKKYPKTYIKIIKNQYPNLKNEIENFCNTNKLNINNFTQKLYHYMYSLTYKPVCRFCKKKYTSFNGCTNIFEYKKYCSAFCSSQHDEVINKKVSNRPNRSEKERCNNILDILLEKNYEIWKKDVLKLKIEYALNIYDFNNLLRTLLKNDEKLIYNIFQYWGDSIYQKIYNILYDIEDYPECIVCSKKTSFKNFKDGYASTCSANCSSIISQRNIKNKIEDNLILTKELNRTQIKEQLGLILGNKVYITQNTVQELKFKHPNLYLNIINHTSYLKKSSKITERLYHVLYDLYEIPKCEKCGETIDIKFTTFKNGYSSLCKQCGSKERGILLSKSLSHTLRDRNYNNYINIFEKEKDGYHIISTKDEFINNGCLKIYHEKCGYEYEKNGNYFSACPYCNPKHKTQNNVARWIRLHEINVEVDKRKYLDNKFEIDIYLPDYKLGIEYNDLSTHSERANKDRNYHLNKTQLCEEKGITLIHLLSTEWGSKRSISKSIILSKLGIFDQRIPARKCVIKEVDSKTKNLFLEKNHRQGADKSSTKLGLYYNNELVSVMTFGKRKITGGKSQTELIRFCTRLNTQVIGGASKLFQFYINNYWDGEEIVSYADRRWSNGGLYNHLGFYFSHYSSPNYWYIVDGELQHRVNYQKHKLKDKLENFNPDLTEWENMQMNGFDRIWDCGTLVYKYK